MERTTTTFNKKKIAARHVSNPKGSGTVVISLGGSLVFPKQGIDIHFIRQFRSFVLRYVRHGWRFVIVTGGGWICRHYQGALFHAGGNDTRACDWIGIYTTRTNAHLLRLLFGTLAAKDVITQPSFLQRRLLKKYAVVVAGGEKPGQTTDHVAVQCALHIGARVVINLSNVDYIYNRDPKQKGARPLKELTWREFKKLFPKKHTPGAHVPFDPRARRLAANAKLTVAFLGSNLFNVDSFFQGKKFRGTIVS